MRKGAALSSGLIARDQFARVTQASAKSRKARHGIGYIGVFSGKSTS